MRADKNQSPSGTSRGMARARVHFHIDNAPLVGSDFGFIGEVRCLTMENQTAYQENRRTRRAGAPEEERNMSIRSYGHRGKQAVIGAAYAAALLLDVHAADAQPIPADAQATCTVSAAEFATCFESRSVALNGAVKPTDSVAFPNIPNCSFHRWSMQMFLWATSPTPSRYGSGAHIFDSPTFYDVSPPDANEVRTFIPHTGKPRLFHLRATKLGPHRLPVIFDKKGRMFEIEPTQLGPGRKPLILNQLKKTVEVESMKLDRAGKPLFLDKAGKAIP